MTLPNADQTGLQKCSPGQDLSNVLAKKEEGRQVKHRTTKARTEDEKEDKRYEDNNRRWKTTETLLCLTSDLLCNYSGRHT